MDDTAGEMRATLLQKKAELEARLGRITANVRRGFAADSRERAQQFEDREVVDALGIEARQELAKIGLALRRIETEQFGRCEKCGHDISAKRLRAYPCAVSCIDCATLDEDREARA